MMPDKQADTDCKACQEHAPTDAASPASLLLMVFGGGDGPVARLDVSEDSFPYLDRGSSRVGGRDQGGTFGFLLTHRLSARCSRLIPWRREGCISQSAKRVRQAVLPGEEHRVVIVIAVVVSSILLMLVICALMFTETTKRPLSAVFRPTSWTGRGVALFAGVLLVGAPALLILLHRQTVVLDGFPDADQAVPTSLIANALRGERLVPPPSLPSDVFMTEDIRRLRPEVVLADRRWEWVDPELQQRVLAIFTIMHGQYGYEMALVEGYRSPERQSELARRGTATRAAAWQSCHQYGLALDSALVRNGALQWDMADPWTRRGYLLFGALAEQAGLEWGGSWRAIKDYVHVELGEQCRQAKASHRAGAPAM